MTTKTVTQEQLASFGCFLSLAYSKYPDLDILSQLNLDILSD